MSIQLSLDNVLINIPPKKLSDAVKQTIINCEECGKLEPLPQLDQACKICRVLNDAKQRWCSANLPVKYWDLQMKDFKGDPMLLTKYKEITEDCQKSYLAGTNICLAGSHGNGKTYFGVNVLKKVVSKGYSAIYLTLSDIISVLTESSSEDKAMARRALLISDWIFIDEFDGRHFSSSEASSNLFGRLLENVFRTRAQNNMPIIMATNSPDPISSFQGSIKESIGSLMNYTTIIPVLGRDYRQLEKK